jgi:hypothetical protein
MENGQTLRIAVRCIENGYLTQLEKTAGYRTAESGQRFYSTLADIESDLPDLLIKADELKIDDMQEDF